MNGPAAVQSKPSIDVNEMFKLCQFSPLMVKITVSNSEDVNLYQSTSERGDGGIVALM